MAKFRRLGPDCFAARSPDGRPIPVRGPMPDSPGQVIEAPLTTGWADEPESWELIRDADEEEE